MIAAMEIFQAALLLFIIIDPVGNAPIFASVLRDLDGPAARRVILRESLIALAIMVSTLFAGSTLMGWLGLTQPALGLAGGIILFLISLRMIFPAPGGVFGENDQQHGGRVPWCVPLAVPLLAGPSAIATLMLLAARDPQRMGDWSLALGAAWIISTAILLCAPWLGRVIGRNALEAVQRLLGMLLTAVAVQQFLDGWKAAFGS
jgi:multiple antibiotic resistance protein